ncbi:MAG: hypothetical protein HY544_01065 [Candidatus Diapherotrites archaeon]|uniref:Transglutaminase-like domain-containing protein n=1 Tax=Candidatus Iainarchaeum sp. TaxID=3101447 RepID=A0A8T3YJV6_9ARCH|nr:hypothetical protein [Candidatus Diapherotrites archaeon]
MVLGVGQRTGLKRTTAEKELLHSISAIEDTLASEADEDRRTELESQLTSLKMEMAMVSGATYAMLRLENARLKKEIATLLRHVGTTDTGYSRVIDSSAVDGAIRYYRAIIARYSDIINRKEEKTVGGIKALVSKDDLTVQSIVNSISGEGYKFPVDFMRAAEKAFNYVRDEITYVDADIGISFWLTPMETVSEGIADDEDKSVFLCSLLYTLGDQNAEVVIAELDNSKTHAFVVTVFNGNFVLLDTCQHTDFRHFSGDKADVLKRYSFGGSRIKRFLYRFNNSKYEQFTE